MRAWVFLTGLIWPFFLFADPMGAHRHSHSHFIQALEKSCADQLHFIEPFFVISPRSPLLESLKIDLQSKRISLPRLKDWIRRLESDPREARIFKEFWQATHRRAADALKSTLQDSHRDLLILGLKDYLLFRMEGPYWLRLFHDHHPLAFDLLDTPLHSWKAWMKAFHAERKGNFARRLTDKKAANKATLLLDSQVLDRNGKTRAFVEALETALKRKLQITLVPEQLIEATGFLTDNAYKAELDFSLSLSGKNLNDAELEKQRKNVLAWIKLVQEHRLRSQQNALSANADDRITGQALAAKIDFIASADIVFVRTLKRLGQVTQKQGVTIQGFHVPLYKVTIHKHGQIHHFSLIDLTRVQKRGRKTPYWHIFSSL